MPKRGSKLSPVLIATLAVALAGPVAVLAAGTTLVSPVTVTGASGNVMTVNQTSSSSAGVAVRGAAAAGDGVVGSSTEQNGVQGSTTGTGSVTNVWGGVVGIDSNSAASNYGVIGFSPNTGILGATNATSTGAYGIEGYSSSTFAEGVLAGTGGIGIEALGYGTTGGNPALYAHEYNSGVDALGVFNSADHETVEVKDKTQNSSLCTGAPPCTAGGDTYIFGDLHVYGLIYASNHGGGTTPLLHRRSRSGATVSTYASEERRATIEDRGEAQLAYGQTYVRLDPDFAGTIDSSRPYQVFITPEGDTHGMFVTSRTLQGFYVRETMGGRSNTPFAYRIEADAQSQPSQADAFPHQTDPVTPSGPSLARALKASPAFAHLIK